MEKCVDKALHHRYLVYLLLSNENSRFISYLPRLIEFILLIVLVPSQGASVIRFNLYHCDVFHCNNIIPPSPLLMGFYRLSLSQRVVLRFKFWIFAS